MMAIVDGQFRLDPSEYQHPWTGGHRHVDMRARPGRRTDLPDGVYASRLANGRQTTSCSECRGMLAGYANPTAALAAGFECGMYGKDKDQLGYCYRQALAVGRK